jgi:hypothetical protein
MKKMRFHREDAKKREGRTEFILSLLTSRLRGEKFFSGIFS